MDTSDGATKNKVGRGLPLITFRAYVEFIGFNYRKPNYAVQVDESIKATTAITLYCWLQGVILAMNLFNLIWFPPM